MRRSPCRIARPLGVADSVGKPTVTSRGNRTGGHSFSLSSYPARESEMYLGIGGIIILIIILYLLFR